MRIPQLSRPVWLVIVSIFVVGGVGYFANLGPFVTALEQRGCNAITTWSGMDCDTAIAQYADGHMNRPTNMDSRSAEFGYSSNVVGKTRCMRNVRSARGMNSSGNQRESESNRRAQSCDEAHSRLIKISVTMSGIIIQKLSDTISSNMTEWFGPAYTEFVEQRISPQTRQSLNILVRILSRGRR